MYIQIHTHYVYLTIIMYTIKKINPIGQWALQMPRCLAGTMHTLVCNLSLKLSDRKESDWWLVTDEIEGFVIYSCNIVLWWLMNRWNSGAKKVARYISYHFMTFCLSRCLHKTISWWHWILYSFRIFFTGCLMSSVLFSWWNRYLITVISGQLLLLTQQNQSALEICNRYHLRLQAQQKKHILKHSWTNILFSIPYGRFLQMCHVKLPVPFGCWNEVLQLPGVVTGIRSLVPWQQIWPIWTYLDSRHRK